RRSGYVEPRRLRGNDRMRTRIFTLLALVVSSLFFRAPAQTWEQTTAPSLNYPCIASTADGTTLLTSGFRIDIPIYISTNAGGTWDITSAPVGTCAGIASSAGGNKLVAVYYSPSHIYTSLDAGLSWISNNAPTALWN